MIPALIIDAIRFLADKIFGISLSKKLEKDPNNVQLLMKMAIINLKKNDYKISLEFFNRVYNLQPENKVALFYSGLFNLRLKDFEKSRIFFDAYILNPIDKPIGDVEKEIFYLLPEAYYYLGYCYSKLNEVEKSAKFKNIAISKDRRILKLTMY